MQRRLIIMPSLLSLSPLLLLLSAAPPLPSAKFLQVSSSKPETTFNGTVDDLVENMEFQLKAGQYLCLFLPVRANCQTRIRVSALTYWDQNMRLTVKDAEGNLLKSAELRRRGAKSPTASAIDSMPEGGVAEICLENDGSAKRVSVLLAAFCDIKLDEILKLNNETESATKAAKTVSAVMSRMAEFVGDFDELSATFAHDYQHSESTRKWINMRGWCCSVGLVICCFLSSFIIRHWFNLKTGGAAVSC